MCFPPITVMLVLLDVVVDKFFANSPPRGLFLICPPSKPPNPKFIMA